MKQKLEKPQFTPLLEHGLLFLGLTAITFFVLRLIGVAVGFDYCTISFFKTIADFPLMQCFSIMSFIIKKVN